MSKSCDKPKSKLQLEFNVILSFAQELRLDPLSPSGFVSASNTIENPDLKGTAKLRFSPDFLTLNVEINIIGDLSGDHAVTLSHIHLDGADKTGPLTVELYPKNTAVVKNKKREFNLKVELNNNDVIPRSNGNYGTNSIASLYAAIRGDNLYVDVHGGGDYLLGMLRGQIYLNP